MTEVLDRRKSDAASRGFCALVLFGSLAIPATAGDAPENAIELRASKSGIEWLDKKNTDEGVRRALNAFSDEVAQGRDEIVVLGRAARNEIAKAVETLDKTYEIASQSLQEQWRTIQQRALKQLSDIDQTLDALSESVESDLTMARRTIAQAFATLAATIAVTPPEDTNQIGRKIDD